MKLLRAALLTFVFALSACAPKFAPTPIMIGDLVESNDKVHELYSDCSEGANYVADKAGCTPEALLAEIDNTQEIARQFISADIKQTQGYDIYLAVSMIEFRISTTITTREYTEAERIARQFFEVQKATSGRSMDDAVFYWVAISTAHAAWQWNNDRLALDPERKSTLLLAYAQGNVLMEKIEPGPRKVRLAQYLSVLKQITDRI